MSFSSSATTSLRTANCLLAQSHPHFQSWLELDNTFCGNCDWSKGPWIKRLPRLTILHLEDAKIPELQAVTFAQFSGDPIENTLHNILHDDPFLARPLCNLMHQLFLRNGLHGD